MQKRKRAVAFAELADRASVRALEAEARIDHGHILLHRALKTAKGFERQKLSRRQKTASSANDAAARARIDGEIEALKTLDLSTAASNYLAKSLLKVKAVATSPDRPANLREPPSQANDPAVLNVLARLCKSNAVRDVLARVLNDVEAALGLDRQRTDSKLSTLNRDTMRPSASGEGAASNREVVSLDGMSNESQGFSADDSATRREAEADDFSAFDARLASSSSDGEAGTRPVRSSFDPRQLLEQYDSHDEASSASDSEPSFKLRKGMPKSSPRRHRTTSPSLSPSPSPPPPPPRTRAGGTSSAFLPSLTMAGYISGSDSAGGATDVDDDGLAAAAPRKNRRGQQARRAIWEKKFGSNAKHVKDGLLAGKSSAASWGDRREGWDPRRGATDGSARGGRGRAGRGTSRSGGGSGSGRGSAGRGGGGGGARTGAGPVEGSGVRANLQAKLQHRDDAGQLHPSWEAAKKRKEQAEKVAAPFQGKKVTFD